jgi:hypothetical protein
MSVYEVIESLDISKESVAELEAAMDIVKDDLASESRKEAIPT